jgi:hypothetical protein
MIDADRDKLVDVNAVFVRSGRPTLAPAAVVFPLPMAPVSTEIGSGLGGQRWRESLHDQINLMRRARG